MLTVADDPATAHDGMLPIGDGKVSDQPKIGHVYSCRQRFRQAVARHDGPWFHGELWAPDEKPRVRGERSWPQARFSALAVGSQLQIKSNGLPVGTPTGEFPIARSDPAYQYDTNPNPISEVAVSLTLPVSPQRATEPSCVPMGMIGIATTGVALYNALDDAGNDAAAHEIQDLCDGHPQRHGQYHYHNGSRCLPGAKSNRLIGWSLDGFPILGMVDSSGKTLSNSDLDACHGRAESVQIDGRHYEYAYRLTAEYPYLISCFTGTVSEATWRAVREATPRSEPRRGVANRQDRPRHRANRPRGSLNR